MVTICSVDDCGKWADRMGMCFAHYYRVLRTGSPKPSEKPSVADRFWDKVWFTEDCWLWVGALHTYGHGSFRADKVSWKAHRWAWTFINGPIPSGVVLDHLCRVPSCVNPDHLEPTTQSENTRRGRSVNRDLPPVPSLIGRPKESPETRFWRKVEKTGECWLWKASTSHFGHGQFKDGDGKMVRAHRFAWMLTNGPIPEGAVLDHLCRTPACVNPDHLEVVTRRENTMRGRGVTVQATKTHCPRGHEYNEENTQMVGTHRHCRVCKRERMAEKRAEARPDDWTRIYAGRNSYKTHCKYGHELFGQNLMVTPNKANNSGTQRRCRICHNATSYRNAAKRRAG